MLKTLSSKFGILNSKWIRLERDDWRIPRPPKLFGNKVDSDLAVPAWKVKGVIRASEVIWCRDFGSSDINAGWLNEEKSTV